MEDARRSLEVETFILPPEPIQALWRQVPPEPNSLGGYLEPVSRWLAANADRGDLVLIQGEFGATYLMVRFAMENHLIPIYSTTERHAVEEHQPDGSVRLTHSFRHCRFRKYGE